MSARVRAVTILAVIAVLTVGMVAVVMQATPSNGQAGTATTSPAAPTTLTPPTTDRPDCTATTDGKDPEAFRPRCRGPLVVTVTEATCLKDVGDGYRLAYRIDNRGPAVTAYVAAQVDDKPSIITENSLALPAGGSFTDQADYQDVAGDGLVITLVSDDAGTISSFPAELPHCPQAREDIREAERATTTT